MSRSPGVVRASDGLPTVAEVLEREGFDWDRLDRLARRALRDRMRARGVSLDDERFELAVEFCVDRGATRAREFDAALAKGIAFETFLYRRMFNGLDDFLRGERGDSRRGRPLRVELTDQGVLPESVGGDIHGLDDAIAEVESRLSAEALWTLENLGRPVIAGAPLRVAAVEAGLSFSDARARWFALRAELAEAA